MYQRKTNKKGGDLPAVTPTPGVSSAPSPKISPKNSSSSKGKGGSEDKLDTRTTVERDLFKLVKEGKLGAAQAILREKGDNIDINALDPDNLDLLTHAVKTKDEKLVEFVLFISPDTIITSDGLLEAIKLNEQSIVLKILNVAEERDQNNGKADKIKLAESYQKRADKVRLPPFVQAATSGHYEMLELLYNRSNSYRMPALHAPRCTCGWCNPLTGMLYKEEGLMTPSEENVLTGLGMIEEPENSDVETNNEEGTTTNAEGTTTETESAYLAPAKKGKKGKKLEEKKKKAVIKKESAWSSWEKTKVRTLKQKGRFVKRDLWYIKRRIGILTAKANPKFMIFMSSKDGDFDPVYECFELSRVAKLWATRDPNFNLEYMKIREKADALPLKLLDLCRTTDEISILLGVKEGYVGGEIESPRLGYAVICKQKKFVAHHHAQCLMYREWLGAVRWNTRDSCEHFLKDFTILLSILVAPALACVLWLFLVCPSGWKKSKLFGIIMAPVNRARAKFGSYLWFCVALYLISTRERSPFDIKPVGDGYSLFLHSVVVTFTVSFLVANIRHLLYNPTWYLRRRWNLYDMLLIICLTITEGWAIWAYWKEEKPSRECVNVSLNFWSGYEQFTSRERLDADHPLFNHESAFAVTTTIAMCRVFRILILDHRVGPVQTALGKMFNAFKSYAVVFVIFFATVVVGMRMLVLPYQHVTGKTPTSSQILDMLTLMKKMFDSGLSRKDVELETPKKTVVIDGKKEVVENPQDTTQYFLYLIVLVFGVVYKFLKAIFTGMMSSTRKAVQNAKEIEWRYLRTQEWLYHIQDSKLAYPLNALPNCDCIGECWSKFRQNWRENEKVEERRRQYPFLMRRLFQRYFQNVEASDADKCPTKGDVEKIQKSITVLRQIGNSLVDEEIGSERWHLAGSQTEEDAKTLLGPTSSSGAGDGAEKEEEEAESQEPTVKVVMPPKSMGSL